MSEINFTDERSIAEAQEALADAKELAMDVSDCAACNGSHEDVKFIKLKQPADDGAGNIFTHVSECPVSGLQLRLAFAMPALVAARERAAQVAQVGRELRVDGMSEADIRRVLDALKESNMN